MPPDSQAVVLTTIVTNMQAHGLSDYCPPGGPAEATKSGGGGIPQTLPYLTQSLADRWSLPLAVTSPWLLLLRVRVRACVCDKQRKTLCALCSLLYF